MAVERLTIDNFTTYAQTLVVLDVRSPKEYNHAHYPNALSLPLFSDEERKIVGTTYKQQSRKKAIKIGLDFFGPKMRPLVNRVEKILDDHHQNSVIVYCWRGGMRSAAIAWLLDFYGFDVYRLEGGYKAIRNWALEQFKKTYNLKIMGGYTGSAKTELLGEMHNHQCAVIDLEGLAGHKGSAFGNLNNTPQISTEQFENTLALNLYQITNSAKNTPQIWLESESSRIGNVNIPFRFFNQMKAAPRVNIEVPYEKRLEFILQNYGGYDTDKLIAATRRIKKRLGGLATQQVISFLQKGETKQAFAILLRYYDKAYAKSRKKFQDAATAISLPDTNAEKNIHAVLKTITPTYEKESY